MLLYLWTFVFKLKLNLCLQPEGELGNLSKMKELCFMPKRRTDCLLHQPYVYSWETCKYYDWSFFQGLLNVSWASSVTSKPLVALLVLSLCCKFDVSPKSTLLSTYVEITLRNYNGNITMFSGQASGLMGIWERGYNKQEVQTAWQAVLKLEFQAVMHHWLQHKWSFRHQKQEQIDDKPVSLAEENKQRPGYDCWLSGPAKLLLC